MQWLVKRAEALGGFLNVVAGVALTFMMLLTTLDVILRFFRMPVVGTYELVAFAGGVVIGFALPQTTLTRGHVVVDFFITRFSPGRQAAFHMATRFLGILLFIVVGWNMLRMGMDMLRTGEVSLTLEMPFYPVSFGIGFACFVQCLALAVQLYQAMRGGAHD